MDRPLRIYPILERSKAQGAAPDPLRAATPEQPGRRGATTRIERMKAEAEGGTVCQIRNVRVGARRTTLRLEGAFWDAFDALCAREGTSVDLVLSDLERERHDEALTSMVRSYLVAYWRRRAGEA
jgi:predicted DNA-binding ribbon-helix-helix protein